MIKNYERFMNRVYNNIAHTHTHTLGLTRGFLTFLYGDIKNHVQDSSRKF